MPCCGAGLCGGVEIWGIELRMVGRGTGYGWFWVELGFIFFFEFF